MTDDIARLSAFELVDHYRQGVLSPVEATLACLQRIDDLNPALNAMNLVDADGALAAARASEERWAKGRPIGAVDGVPTTVKDLVLARGWPTLRGSKTVDPDQPWIEDAPAVARLREAGAVLIGRTTTPEMGWKGVTDSPLTGITRNPWDPGRTPGGSSGGAAVAAAVGMAALNIGTDGGGSIRIPASFTGIYGLKPSYGRVPAHPLSPFGTIAHVGPMTRTVTDAALMLQVIAQPDRRDWTAFPYQPENFLAAVRGDVKGLRIAYARTIGDYPVDPEVAAGVESATATFRDLGAIVEETTLPLTEASDVFFTHWTVGAAAMMTMIPEEKHELMDPGLRRMAEAGARIGTIDFVKATMARQRLGAAMNQFHEACDLILLPAMQIPAFEVGHDVPSDGLYKDWPDWTPFTYPFNLTQQPAASVPCGLTASGLPIAFQIVGPPHGDAAVINASRAFERARPWPMPDLDIGR